jgi:hypothetical protein
MDNQLQQVEGELQNLLKAEQSSWINVYRLMKRVETDQLWKENYKSFTQWVSHLSLVSKVHVSLIWKQKKAGEICSKYAERNGKTLDEMKVSPDNAVLAAKIAKGNVEVEDDLMDKIVHGELSRSDLKNAWATVKAENDATKNNDNEDVNSDIEEGGNQESTPTITAKDIVLALQRASYWKPNYEANQTNFNRTRTNYYYHTTEFPVYTGTSRNSRRIDYLIASNDEDEHHVTLYGIEIKVSKYDLINDHKMLEYRDFVDYLYFAVPEDLKEVVEEIVDPEAGIGIITINEKHELTIAKSAKLSDAPSKFESLETLLIRKK